MMLSLVACLLAQAPLAPGAELPPGHPPLTAPPTQPLPAPSTGTLPPNHPMGTQPSSDPLPPNHPSLGTGPSASGQAPTMEELVRRLDAQPDLATREKPFELAESIARLYYGQARFRDAALYFDQAVKKADPVRTFYLAQKRAAGATPPPAPETVGCAPGPKVTMDELFKKALETAHAWMHIHGMIVVGDDAHFGGIAVRPAAEDRAAT